MSRPATPYGIAAGAFVERSVKALMHQVLADAVYHAECVAAGPFRFRQAFTGDFGVYWGNARADCDRLADITFRFFEVQWRRRHPGVSAAQFLDRVEIVSPPTEAEIEDAWEIEIGSSDSAMRQMYEGSARHRKGRDLGARTTRPEVKT